MTRYGIHMIGHRAICPECSGIMAGGAGEDYRCIDCGGTFRIVDLGMSENEMTCEKIEKEEATA